MIQQEDDLIPAHREDATHTVREIVRQGSGLDLVEQPLVKTCAVLREVFALVTHFT